MESWHAKAANLKKVPMTALNDPTDAAGCFHFRFGCVLATVLDLLHEKKLRLSSITMIQRVLCSLATLNLLLLGAYSAGEGMMPTACTSISSCMECLETPECGTWQSGEYAICQSSCAGDDCFSMQDFPGQSSDVICSIAANAQADASLCDDLEDCGECVSTLLNDGTSTCQWYSEEKYCSSGCKSNGECGETTCQPQQETFSASSSTTNMDALCKGLSCNFCIDLNCAWAPSVGCFASCDGIATNCLDGSQHNAADICTPPNQDEESPTNECDGLSCDFCLGVGSCAWSDEQGCVESCDAIATSRCFPSDTYEAADVCNAEQDETKTNSTISTETNSTTTTNEEDKEDTKCMEFTSCEECLSESCDWAPDAGCIGNCSVFDMSCYPGAVYRSSAYQVCSGEASLESETSGVLTFSTIVVTTTTILSAMVLC